jgi:hypothetical protein
MDQMKDMEEFAIHYDITARLALVAVAKVLTVQESDALLSGMEPALSELYPVEKVKPAVGNTKEAVNKFREAFNSKEVNDENNQTKC